MAHTYSGHPVSAAVALEVIRLYEEGGILANGQKVARHFEAGLQAMCEPSAGGRSPLARLAGCARAGQQQGQQGGLRSVAGHVRPDLHGRLRNGLIFRAFTDDILGFAPALCYTATEFELLFERLKNTLDAVLDQLPARVRKALRRGLLD